MPGKIADSKLASKGRRSYEWAASHMSIVEKIRAKNERAQSLAGFRLAFCLHITKETSVLVLAAKSLGADIAICSANPLSTQDDIELSGTTRTCVCTLGVARQNQNISSASARFLPLNPS